MQLYQHKNKGVRAAIIALITASQTSFMLWVPVFLSVGIGTFFGLSTPLAFGAFTSILVCFTGVVAIGWLSYRFVDPAQKKWWSFALQPYIPLAILLILLGGMSAYLRLDGLTAPTLKHKVSHVIVEGELEKVIPYSDGSYHLYIQFPHFSGLYDRREIPEVQRLRLRARAYAIDMVPRAGDTIRLSAGLMPLPPPLTPGGYDYASPLWFQGIGAVGYVKSPVDIIERPRQKNWKLQIHDLRTQMATRIQQQTGRAELGAVTTALLTGLRGEIPPDVVADLRHAGLAHLLAISGLHMGLMAGVMFFLLRAIFALIPIIALHLPIKKIAAGGALIWAAGYLLLSGASLPTLRAFIMTAIVLVAVMIDRRAISLRLVAIAATILLLIRPESLLSVSFQMSFAAVTALVAVYSGMERKLRVWWNDRAGWIDKIAFYFISVLGTTVVAEAAIMPISMYHFNVVAHYGLLANAIAMPLMVFWVMPGLLMFCLLYLFGLEGFVMPVLELGIDMIISTAHWVSGLRGATGVYTSPPLISFIILILGGLWLCLWRGPVRYGGVLFMLLAAIFIGGQQGPDIMIGPNGKLHALRMDEKDLLFSKEAGQQKRLVEDWRRKAGQKDALRLTVGADYNCDDLGCRAIIKGQTVAFLQSPDGLEETCHQADIVIASFFIHTSQCQTPLLVLDKRDFMRKGSHALWLTHKGQGGIQKVSTVAQERGNWPWVVNSF